MGRWPELVLMLQVAAGTEGELQGLEKPIKAWREERENLGNQNQRKQWFQNGFKRRKEFWVNVMPTDQKWGWTFRNHSS